MIYRGLPEFGLPLITPEDPALVELVREIQSRPQPFPSWPAGDLDTAAVLLNQNRKAIVALTYIWQHTGRGMSKSRHSNLGSSLQLEVLSGHASVVRDLGSFILPGSKRLITERGMFGNNLDVLDPHEVARSGGYMGAGGGGGSRGAAAVALSLDFAVLEDGLCVGPDESGEFESLTAALELLRSTAREALTALRGGASEGHIFEILRPLARRGGRDRSPLLTIFGQMAINRLVNTEKADFSAWLARYAETPPLALRRP